MQRLLSTTLHYLSLLFASLLRTPLSTLPHTLRSDDRQTSGGRLVEIPIADAHKIGASLLDVWHIEADTVIARLPHSLPLPSENCKTIVEDVNLLVDPFEKDFHADWHRCYHPFGEIMDWAQRLPEEHVRYEMIGVTHEGRDIVALHISRDFTIPKPIVWLQFLLHAREWATGAAGMYLTEELLKDDQALLRFEFVVIPVANPDGYVHSWTSDRFWRKNRRPSPSRSPASSSDYGVDLNRNYDDHWGTGDGISSSSDPSSDMYRGPSPASEPETQAIQKHFLDYVEHIVAAVDVHSYGKLILRPCGWSGARPRHEDQLLAVSWRMSEAIKQATGMHYSVERIFDLYPTSGTSTDWFYSVKAGEASLPPNAAGSAARRRAPYSIAIEVRPGEFSTHNFSLPAREIRAVGEEVWQAVRVLAWLALSNPLDD